MKIVSDRPRDLTDGDAIARRRLGDLDRAYLDPRVRELAAALERHEIVERWMRWVSVVGWRPQRDSNLTKWTREIPGEVEAA